MHGHLRRRVIEEWRGLPDADDGADRTVSIRTVITEVARKLNCESLLREEEIISAWREIVGEFFALHSRPYKLAQGTLIVNVLQPTVLYELERSCKSVILAKLKKRFGGKTIKDLRFRSG
jgi:predicted nucleic acid-binding Zn ribbon protein